MNIASIGRPIGYSGMGGVIGSTTARIIKLFAHVKVVNVANEPGHPEENDRPTFALLSIAGPPALTVLETTTQKSPLTTMLLLETSRLLNEVGCTVAVVEIAGVSNVTWSAAVIRTTRFSEPGKLTESNAYV
jgi:hypothetical protein